MTTLEKMMEPITLTRSGKPALRFTGELLAKVDGSDYPLLWGDQKRGTGRHTYTVAAFRTLAGQYVARILYTTTWSGEPGWSDAVPCATLEAVRDVFTAHDPATILIGFWPHGQKSDGTKMEDKQAYLIKALRCRYGEQVSDLLGQLGVVEEI